MIKINLSFIYRLPLCSPKSYKIVIARHEEVLLRVVQLLKSYTINCIDIHKEILSLYTLDKNCNDLLNIKMLTSIQNVMYQQEAVLHAVDKIVLTQLRFISQRYSEHNNDFNSENMFKVIKYYNLVLEQFKASSDALTEAKESKDKKFKEDKASSSLTVTKPGKPPPSPKHVVDKLKVVLTPAPMVSPLSSLKKFTASRILQTMGSVRCEQVTEYIAEALLSRVDVPTENTNGPIPVFPWKPLSLTACLGNKSHLDIFEEALAKEEDENRLNQRKLDMALRQEFGEDFPGTDYLPDSECTEALKPLSSRNMAQLIKSNSSLLQLLFKRFLNTPGVLGE